VLAPPKQHVVVADDSRLMRRMLTDALDRQGFDVVATDADGDEALAACCAHDPDALTLDLAIPGLDGLGVLRALREGVAAPVPVVVVSAFSPARGAHAVDALAEGAFELVAKPTAGQALDGFADEPGRKVADAAQSPRAAHTARIAPRRASHARGGWASYSAGNAPAVVIACSTGGPHALAVVTGMGRDGLEAARAVKAADGRVLVEAEETCTIYGTPRAVAEAGLADHVLPLHELGPAIAREVGA
jgi:two-component system chemotaxis response regulator CheB